MGNGFLDVVPARDISLGGLSVFIAHDFKGCDLNMQVDLIVTLGQSAPFKTKGVIRHRSSIHGSHFFGVEFISLTPEHRAFLEAYVADRLARP